MIEYDICNNALLAVPAHIKKTTLDLNGDVRGVEEASVYTEVRSYNLSFFLSPN